MLLLLQIVDGQGLEVERGVWAAAVGEKGAVDAGPEARAAGFHVDEIGGGLLDREAEPGFAEGDAGGQIEGEQGLFGAGLADEDVEAGAGEKVGNEPFDAGWRAEGIFGGVDVDGGVISVGQDGLGGIELAEHGALLASLDGGEQGGPAAFGAGFEGLPDGVIEGQPFLRQGLGGDGSGAKFDEADEAFGGC